MAPTCFNCGLKPSRESCPLITSTSPADFIENDDASLDVMAGHFRYGMHIAKDDGEPRLWWGSVALDRTLRFPTAYLSNSQLALIAIIRGHKVLRSDSRCVLLGYRNTDGKYAADFLRLYVALKHAYDRRVARGDGPQTPASDNEPVASSTGNGSRATSHNTRATGTAVVQASARLTVSQSRSTSTASGRAVTPLDRSSSSSHRGSMWSDSSSVASSTRASIPYGNRPVTVAHSNDQNPSTGVSRPPSAAVRAANSMCPVCRAMHGVAGSRVCRLVPGLFDVPVSDFDPITFVPTPVTFGEFTYGAQPGESLPRPGWGRYYLAAGPNGWPETILVQGSTDLKREREMADAVLKGFDLDHWSVEQVRSIRPGTTGPRKQEVLAFLLSMETEYARRKAAAMQAQSRSSIPLSTSSLSASTSVSSGAQGLAEPIVEQRVSQSLQVADVAPIEPEPARRGLLASLYDAIVNPLGFL
ncbi:hypothetical protein EXIGLDRAFT_828074 [Exidia glandulosa HHB12029]|uniref:Uncharacterized protein n=1 Tax=Exidia glandulosa HHB12029 TaxID=1314781 RepID=A0A165QW75_EXIGL|nr:hypothetical protein EXIGLDRAFT_828074 [Exidia glandulosa HHB12029]